MMDGITIGAALLPSLKAEYKMGRMKSHGMTGVSEMRSDSFPLKKNAQEQMSFLPVLYCTVLLTFCVKRQTLLMCYHVMDHISLLSL